MAVSAYSLLKWVGASCPSFDPSEGAFEEGDILSPRVPKRYNRPGREVFHRRKHRRLGPFMFLVFPRMVKARGEHRRRAGGGVFASFLA